MAFTLRSSSDRVQPLTQPQGFSFEVQERCGRWHVEENGVSVAAFDGVEDAAHLALAYAHARSECGNPAVVFLRTAERGRHRIAKFGLLRPFALSDRSAA